MENSEPLSLINAGYRIDARLRHTEIFPFVIENLRRKNPLTKFFNFVNVMGICAFGFFFIRSWIVGGFLSSAIPAIFGVLTTILLIPLHEGVHALAYYLAGAKHVTFGVNWRPLYFTAASHNFIANYKNFMLIGLAPFIVINSIGLLLFITNDPDIILATTACLFFHNAMCAGDFGILSYMYSKKGFSPVTYDDLNESVSYFLIKEGN